MIITIGTATTVASVEAEETEMGSVVCDWPGIGVHRTLWFSQSSLVVVRVWYSISLRVIVPFWIPCTMPGCGTMPVKFARYHTVPKAGGAAAAVVYLLELSVRTGAKSVHVFPPSVLCCTITSMFAAGPVPDMVTEPLPSIGLPAYAIGAGGVTVTE